MEKMLNIIIHQKNVNHTHTRYHFILTRMAIIKKQTTSIGKDVEKLKSSYKAGKNVE